jgi:hypothetical protein
MLSVIESLVLNDWADRKQLKVMIPGADII